MQRPAPRAVQPESGPVPEREPQPDRLGVLERELRELREEVAELRAAIASERGGPLQE